MEDFPLLRGLNTNDRAEINEYLQPKGYIFQKGESIKIGNNQVGFVIKGNLKITRSDDDGHYCIAEILTEGDMFSSVYSMFMKDGLYELETSTACRIVLIDYEKIIKCQNREVLNNFVQCIAVRSQKQGERIHQLSQRSLRRKLITYFNHIYSSKAGRVFVIPMSYATLADFLCADRSAMMREIKKMSNDGLIRINGKTIEITDKLFYD